ncbi:MAG: response regulator [Colwellia sp.]|nr:response regulator [Colwellia sp.]
MAKKIHYIEDNPANVFLMEMVFRQFEGFDLTISKCAESGLESIYNSAPNLILMDKDLPKMSGIEAIAQLKADDNYQAIPIILLTADNTDKTREEALGVGCNEVKHKPFDIPDLFNTIKQLLDHSTNK